MAKKATAKKADGKAKSGPSKSVLEAELAQDEKLLWSHRPGPGAFALAHARAAMMGMPFIMAAMLWNGMVMKTMNVAYMGVITWMFATVGVVYLFVPLMAYMRGKIYVFYALTNKRLMILSMFPKHHVQSFPISAVNGVFVKDVQYGVGSMIIDAPGASPKNPAKPRAGFYGVPYVARVVDAFNMLKNPEATRQAAMQQAREQQMREKQVQKDQAATLVPSAGNNAPAAPSAAPAPPSAPPAAPSSAPPSSAPSSSTQAQPQASSASPGE